MSLLLIAILRPALTPCLRSAAGLRPRNKRRKPIEELAIVLWTRRRLGMVLDGKDRKLLMRQTLDTSIGEIDVADVQPLEAGRMAAASTWKLWFCEVTVTTPVRYLTHRMVGSVMPEGQATGARSRRQPQNLVPEADAQEW